MTVDLGEKDKVLLPNILGLGCLVFMGVFFVVLRGSFFFFTGVSIFSANIFLLSLTLTVFFTLSKSSLVLQTLTVKFYLVKLVFTKSTCLGGGNGRSGCVLVVILVIGIGGKIGNFFSGGNLLVGGFFLVFCLW